MRIEIPIINVPALILRIGGAAQVGMQEGSDVFNIRISKGYKAVPDAAGNRLRITYSHVILVLVDLCVRGIKIRVYGCECRQSRAYANDRTWGNVTDEGEIRVDAQRAGSEVEFPPIKNSFVGYDFASVCKSQALPVDRKRLAIIAQLR